MGSPVKRLSSFGGKIIEGVLIDDVLCREVVYNNLGDIDGVLCRKVVLFRRYRGR